MSQNLSFRFDDLQSGDSRAAGADGRESGERSRLLLFIFLAAYVLYWGWENQGLLFEPALQADDARTSLFPFHRYDAQESLRNDAIANEMLVFVPPAVHLVYRFLVPFTDVYVAAKIVQGLGLAVLGWAGLLLARSGRGTLAVGVLIVFLMLHTPFVFSRGIAGGLPRTFGFPVIALWAAGAIASSAGHRVAAVVIATLTYPPAMLVVLGAEGIFSAMQWRLWDWRDLGRRALWYAGLLAFCLLLFATYSHFRNDVGPIHSLEEAHAEPAFYKDGRLRVLPFKNPLKEFPKHFVLPYLLEGRSIWTDDFTMWPKGPAELIIAAVPVMLISMAVLFRWTPFPVAAVSLIMSSVALYFVARTLAFQLYSPERFYSYGLVGAAIVLGAEGVGLFNVPRFGTPPRSLRARNYTALAFMALLIVFGGDGVAPWHNGMTIDRRDDAALYEHLRSLPHDVQIAAHPFDADGVRLWAARSATEGYETLQPWFKDSWEKKKKRTMDLLDALYATSLNDVLRYFDEYGITHVLLRQERYGPHFREKAALFQPFTDYTTRLLAGVAREDLVLAAVPQSTVVYKGDGWLLVSVDRLRQAWSGAVDRSIRGKSEARAMAAAGERSRGRE